MEHKGEIILITGPLSVGKTAELKRQLLLRSKESNVFVRYKEGPVTQENSNEFLVNNSVGALTCNKLNDIYTDERIRYAKIIAIDDAHKFQDLARFCDASANMCKIVLVAGQCVTANRIGYKPIMELFPLCEKVYKLTGVCKSCNVDSVFDRRTLEPNNYASACRYCYLLYIGM